jgi:hypothetical protein
MNHQEQEEAVKKAVESAVQLAAAEYIARQDRKHHPHGKFDNGGRWFPSDFEERNCCAGIRQPSRSWPYSLMTHCRTMEHVANMYGVEIKLLRKAVAAARAEQTQSVLVTEN